MIDVYEIKDEYIEYLRTTKGFNKVHDSKVLVRTHERKYIGNVFRINNFNYYEIIILINSVLIKD